MTTGIALPRRTAVTKAEQEKQISPEIRYSALFWLFFAGSMAGVVLEGLWSLLTRGFWEYHSATVWGPFCIIYGIGAVAVYLLSALLIRRGMALQFVAFTLAGAAVEYFGSLFQELCFGTVSWDYSGHILNLGGRVSLQMSLLWGVLGVLFIRLVYPPLTRLFGRMRGAGWRIACVALTVFLAANLLVSSAALARWGSRSSGAAATPANAVVTWLDETYDDQTMSRLFPNVRFAGR